MKAPMHLMRHEPSLLETSWTAAPQCEQAQRGGNATLALLRMLRPCARCTSYKRFGSTHDGGYVMCADSLQSVRAGYSFGIDGDDAWGAEVSETLGVPVFEFDCWHTRRPACKGSNCKLLFRKECLSHFQDHETDRSRESKIHKSGKIARSLREHILRNPSQGGELLSIPSGSGEFLLKMDVEGVEWDALHYVQSDVLQLMSQIVVEFHLLDHVACHAYFGSVVKKILDAGFAVAHIHGNNFGSMDVLYDGQYMIPNVLEVTFVHRRSLSAKAPIHSSCVSEPNALPEDMKNAWILADLPQAKLPLDSRGEPVRIGEEQQVFHCRYFCSLTRAYLRLSLGWALLGLTLATLVLLLASMAAFAMRPALKELSAIFAPGASSSDQGIG
jgi:hypothetical protein